VVDLLDQRDAKRREFFREATFESFYSYTQHAVTPFRLFGTDELEESNRRVVTEPIPKRLRYTRRTH
jgi:hypothetical protein